MKHTNTLIIGASVSGLSCASCLQKENINYTIIEKQNMVAAPWRNHYDRLHLHTSKRFSNLPFKKFNSIVPRYPARQQVIDYLEDYAREYGIEPLFNTEAFSIKKVGSSWVTETNVEIFESKYLIMATGPYGKPRIVNIKGKETFPGKIIHSAEYKTGKEFKGQKVLVIGFGNSACEIALDLYEQGAQPSMSVRSPVNVIPRDVLGIPVLALSLLLRNISPRIGDTIAAPLLNLLIGDTKKLGLRKLPYGPLEEIRRYGKIPVLDIGTIQEIKNGNIKIFNGIKFIEGNEIVFEDDRKENFDAIIAAIGYERNLGQIVDVEKDRFDDLNRCADQQKYFGKDGLYFCGYWISPTGQFREISLDAKKIAGDILKKERSMINS